MEDVHDLQPCATLGVEHAPRGHDRLGGVARVDGVGEVPLGNVAGVTEVGLDVGERERRRAVDRLERARQGVHAGHVVAHLLGHLLGGRAVDVHAVLGQFRLNERDPVGRARADVHFDDFLCGLYEFVALGADDADDQHRRGRGVLHPFDECRHFVGEQ